ncbi:hypothetical protein [Klebsiella pneumoniae]|uniref:hypothetical protein n=1 Tax=Klebsiella pneumoniae TaxID=573 RepID=UPI0039EB073E
MKKILIKFSGVFFVVIITVILFLIYYLWGPSLGWMEPAEKFRVLCTIFAVPVFLSLLLVSRYSLVAFASRLRFFCKLNDKQNTRSNNSAHLKQVDISKKIINEVQQVLRHTYGHFWHSKVRILLMTGSVSDVGSGPNSPGKLWKEDHGTVVLLWGGDSGDSGRCRLAGCVAQTAPPCGGRNGLGDLRAGRYAGNPKQRNPSEAAHEKRESVSR